ncbi:TMEM165/GDT1 family protein [Actinophytocola sp.]|uniref:TMEM165/GDT1 family protein n=1 Tax=Actinophytocola sp. TaxID=1872138 RepID=UPI002D806326|nr:TMEM165/GDT1 family protein [Actinophytocola sp.]HET9142741.1 TMEM165/GDT1 family protein [Actinophytocola sp.]
MPSELVAVGTTFLLVFVVELPDKTMVATLILTTRYRGLPVFVGVSAAFAVQCVIAVAFGTLLTLLPDRLVAAVVAALFGLGAVLLLREGFGRQDDEAADATASGPARVSFLRAALTSFGVLFAAEWGDASQFAIAGLTARFSAPVAVGLGGWLALTTVAGIAVLLGGKIRGRLRPRLIQRVAGFVFAGFALLALWQVFNA